MEILKKRGVLESRQGSGYFPKTQNIENDLLQLRRMSEKFADMGIPYNVKILPIEQVPANEVVAQNLNITLNEPVYKICRIFYHEDKNIIIEKSYMPVRLFPSLTEENLYVKLDFIESETEYKIVSAFQRIRAVGADAFLVKNFNVPINRTLKESYMHN